MSSPGNEVFDDISSLGCSYESIVRHITEGKILWTKQKFYVTDPLAPDDPSVFGIGFEEGIVVSQIDDPRMIQGS